MCMKLRNSIDVIDYFVEIYEQPKPKNATAKDIDIDIADILGQKYRYRIDIGNGDIVPPLIDPPVIHHFQLDFYVVYICVTYLYCEFDKIERTFTESKQSVNRVILSERLFCM